MHKRSIVGSRELKTRLGQYLSRVRRGETLLITDRNEPVAELRPVSVGDSPVGAALQRLAADGLISLPRKQTATEFAAVPLRVATSSAARAVSADRDERS